MRTNTIIYAFSAVQVRVLRAYAVIFLLVSAVLTTHSIDNFGNYNQPWVSLLHISINILTALLSGILIYKPHRWQLWTLLHAVLGLHLGFFYGELLGMLIYSAGWLIAQRAGFFRTAKKRKIAFITVIFTMLCLYQLYQKGACFFTNLAKVAFASVVYIVIAVLFHEEIIPEKTNNDTEKNIHHQKSRKNINLNEYGLSERELYYINALLNSMPYKTIAGKLHVSESTVKKGMSVLFLKFGVKCREDFDGFIKEHEFVFPAEYQYSNVYPPPPPPPA